MSDTACLCYPGSVRQQPSREAQDRENHNEILNPIRNGIHPSQIRVCDQETAAHTATHENGKIDTALRFTQGNPIYTMKSFLHISPYSKIFFLAVSSRSESPSREQCETVAAPYLTPSTKRLSCFESPSEVFEQLKRSKSTDKWLHFAVCKEHRWERVSNPLLDQTSHVWHPWRNTEFCNSSLSIQGVASFDTRIPDGNSGAKVRPKILTFPGFFFQPPPRGGLSN